MGLGDQDYDRKYHRRQKMAKIVSVVVSLLFLGTIMYSFIAKALN